MTNARGWYDIPHMPAGAYQLCWEAVGFIAACTPPDQKIVIGSSLASPAPQTIMPQPPSVTGHVAFAGGQPCFAQDPALGLDVQTTVQLLDASGQPIGRPVLADQFGGFVVPNARAPVGVAGPLRLRATCDGFTSETSLLEDGAVARVAFKDWGPAIASLVVGDGSPGQTRAAPGSVVPVHVTVPNAATRRLHYHWLPSAAGPNFVSLDQPAVNWL